MHSFDDYEPFIRDQVLPVMGDLLKDCGWKGNKVDFHFYDNSAPFASIQGRHDLKLEISTGAINALQNHLHDVSPELKAVLAHEAAHIEQPLRYGRLSIMAAPAIAIGAYELVRRVIAANASQEEANKTISESQASDYHLGFLNDKAWQLAKYVAVGALGFTAATFVSRHISRAGEFAADKRAVELTKDPEAVISMLNKLHAAIDHNIADVSKESRGVLGWFENVAHQFASFSHQAHPSLKERTDYIKNLPQAFSRG